MVCVLRSTRLVRVLLLKDPIFVVVRNNDFRLRLMLFIRAKGHLFYLLLATFLFVLNELFVGPTRFVAHLCFHVGCLIVSALGL